MSLVSYSDPAWKILCPWLKQTCILPSDCWILSVWCLFFLSSWLSMAQVFLWQAVQKVLALLRPAKTRSNRRSNRNKSTRTRHMAHAIGRRMGSDQYNRWNRGTAPALPSSSRMLNPDLKKTASAIYNPNPKGKWVDQVNHRATPGSPFDRFFDPFNLHFFQNFWIWGWCHWLPSYSPKNLSSNLNFPVNAIYKI